MHYTSRCQGCSRCKPDKYSKYYEARLWAESRLARNWQHGFAVFFAESDWDDPQAALRDWTATPAGVDN